MASELGPILVISCCKKEIRIKTSPPDTARAGRSDQKASFKVNDFKPTNYDLRSVKTGNTFADAGWTLDAPGEDGATLIRTQYEKRQLTVRDAQQGLFRFADWLPMKRAISGSAAPVTYKSDGLASHLGLSNLYITFNGYWPERGAMMRTCSFKETEAYTVASRLAADCTDTLVVASAGNTARAFARVCSDNGIRLLLCIPEDNLGALWFDTPLNDCVRIVATRSGSDYSDAISLSYIVCGLNGYIAEGGAKNVARRDGMSATVMSAVTTIGRIPDAYFQAVGSGTGAIAAWEANLRFIADGRFGSNKMRLMVSQNAPFQPIYDAWKAQSRSILPFDENEARRHAGIIAAKVLSNRKPPYSIAGGLFDALQDTGGDVIAATNDEAAEAGRLFEKLEGNDINAAASIATASLIKAVAEGKVGKDEVIMLNITGGGEARFKADHKVTTAAAHHIFGIDAAKDEVATVVNALFGK